MQPSAPDRLPIREFLCYHLVVKRRSLTLAMILGAAAMACGPLHAQAAPDSADLIRTTRSQSPHATATSTASKQADWKGVRPGSTTRAQVEALLGRPASVRTGEDGSTQYVYAPGAHLAFNRVIFGAGEVVTLVGIGLFDEKDRIKLSELKARHGEPKRVSDKSLRDPHAEQSIYLFPIEAGLWVVADPATDEVHGATFFDPASGEPDIPVPQASHHK